MKLKRASKWFVSFVAVFSLSLILPMAKGPSRSCAQKTHLEKPYRGSGRHSFYHLYGFVCSFWGYALRPFYGGHPNTIYVVKLDWRASSPTRVDHDANSSDPHISVVLWTGWP